ncbi:acetyltransferase [Dellaglioa algida]|nr:acetyltransferase [Dellaglioa algida]
MIRQATNDDIEEIVQLWYQVNVTAHAFISKDYWKSHFDEVKKMLPLAEIIVYEENGVITGFIGLNDTYISGIFVSSNVQSKGIGKQLLDDAKKIKSELSLNVYQKNERATHFYLREGFIIKSEDMDTDNNEKEYLMVWKK